MRRGPKGELAVLLRKEGPRRFNRADGRRSASRLLRASLGLAVLSVSLAACGSGENAASAVVVGPVISGPGTWEFTFDQESRVSTPRAEKVTVITLAGDGGLVQAFRRTVKDASGKIVESSVLAPNAGSGIYRHWKSCRQGVLSRTDLHANALIEEDAGKLALPTAGVTLRDDLQTWIDDDGVYGMAIEQPKAQSWTTRSASIVRNSTGVAVYKMSNFRLTRASADEAWFGKQASKDQAEFAVECKGRIIRLGSPTATASPE